MGSGHGAHFFWSFNPDEAGKVFDIAFIGPLGFGVIDVGEPFEFRGHVG